METLEIKSARDLTVDTLEMTSPGMHSYQIDRHQFIAAYSARQHNQSATPVLFSLMTAAVEQIWLSDRESAEVAAAIRKAHSTVTLD